LTLLPYEVGKKNGNANSKRKISEACRIHVNRKDKTPKPFRVQLTDSVCRRGIGVLSHSVPLFVVAIDAEFLPLGNHLLRNLLIANQHIHRGFPNRVDVD